MTALVAQLYREQQAAQDRVMFDAWQNGGAVDGKPVTDSRLRSYIAGRRDGFSKDDPLYDDWNNRLTQIDFKIGEDKIQLAFQQGKVSAGAVASFYKGQLDKIPKDSAFYRDVAGRAAQWGKAAGSAARGGARRRLSSHVDGKIAATDKQLANAAAINDIVQRAAVRAGLINDGEPVTQADASRLQDLFNAGIVGPKGTTVTFNDWRNSVMAAYKTFDAKIALNEQLNRGTKTLKEDKAKYFQQYVLGTNAVDDRAKYEAARDIWLEATQDANGDPRAVLDANKKYADALGKIMKDAAAQTGNNANPDEFIGGLQNEINAVSEGKYTGPGVVDYYKRSDAGDFDNTVGQGDDTKSSADSFVAATDDAKALGDGTAYYGQDEYGGKMGVIHYQPGSEMDPFGKHGLGPDSQPAIVNINGKPTQVVLKGKPVQSFGLTTADGTSVQQVNGVPVENLSPQQIANLVQSGQYSIADGDGQTVGYVFNNAGKTTYGYIDPASGDMKFTDANPFTGAFRPTDGGFSLIVGTTENGAGDVTNVAPTLTGQNGTLSQSGDSMIVDPTISPKDLRNLSLNSTDGQAGADLAAIADKRQSDAKAEADYMNRAKGNAPTEANPFAAFGGNSVNEIVRSLLNVSNEIATPKVDSPPDINLGAPGSFRPQPSTAPPAIKTKAPPAPPPTPPPALGGGAPGAYRPPPPPPKPITDSRSESQNNKKPPKPPAPRPGANNPAANKAF